jgi:Na+-transporting methylmalonyl-CoA/oxaloacetate decarboxylase gamma subunit
MKLTRVILLALAFAIPTMSTTVASAEDAPAAAGEEKPAKGKKGKKAKKAEKKEDKAEAAK